jgi:hypothetical protein
MIQSRTHPVVRVVGLCHAITDITFVLDDIQVREAYDSALLAPGVSFATADSFVELKRRLVHRFPHSGRSSPGGPVSNSLFAMGTRLARYPRPLSLAWSGPHKHDLGALPRAADLVTDPLASLSGVGVRTLVSSTTDQVAESICVVVRDTGEMAATIVGPRGTRIALPELDADDVLLLRLAELENVLKLLNETVPCPLAVVTADHVARDANLEALERIAADGVVRFIFGGIREFSQLGVIEDDRITPAFVKSEIVATDRGAPVRVFASGRDESLPLPVALLGGDRRRTFVGAGDAYAGAYLCARILGAEPVDAHQWGTSEARLSSYSISARRDYSANLTEMFGAFIERQSATPDWDVRNRVRQTSGLTIVSSGSSGVDALGLAAAQRWGLASFAITQAGRRAEAAEKGWFGGADVIELGSERNRYATWANVFVADGTLLFDAAGSEGSDETRRAADVLNRPLLDVTRILPQELPRMVGDWIQANAIRVLNVAGNRSSGLVGAGDATRAYETIDASVLAAALKLGAPAYATDQSRNSGAHTRVGFPNLEEIRQIVDRFLRCCYATGLAPGLLLADVPSARLHFARSRDLVRMVDRRALDWAFVGGDMVADSPGARVVNYGELGVFNVVVALVARNAALFAPRVIVSQYEHIARQHLPEDVEVVRIEGAAETWVGREPFDGAIDTWRTGRTARLHGLELVDGLRMTSLTLIGSAEPDDSPGEFIDAFVRWLHRGAPNANQPARIQ